MNFQRFVAWENLPSLTPKSDDFDSSSLNSESVSEYESGGLTVPKVATTKKETMPNEVEIPISVRRVLDKIDVAQLERAKKEISKKLFRILENVNRVYERYKKDDAIDPKIEKEYNTLLTWEEKNRRSHFLDEIDSVLNQNTDKLLELHLALESFKECSGMLKNVELEEELIPSEEMVQKMEVDLLKLIERIEENVLHLIKLFQPLFAEKLKAPRKPGQKYTLLFKAWRDKVADTPQEGEPLTPEQMLDDEALAFSRCHDVNNMIHELGESQFFNKAEIVALKYTATMVGNLIKAFSLLVKQCRNLKLKCDSLTLLEGRKQDPQVLVLQRELRMAMERKTALEKQVQSAEERCMALLVTNEMIQKELQDANEKASMADKIPLSKVTAGKTQSKASILEKDVKSKPAEKPKLPTEPKKKLPRKVEETMDERWDSQGEDSQISLLSIYGKDRTPTGSFLDIKMKQKKTVSDKGKIKQPPKATDEKGPPMHGTVTERSPALLDQMLTSHKTLDTESDKMVPKSSDEKPVETSPSTMEYSSLTEPTAEDVSGLQKDRKGARRRLSMKGTVDKVLLNVKTKKIVKFPPTKDTPTVDMPSEDITPLFTTVQEIPEGESTQMPTMTSETKTEPETLDKTLTQTAAAEKSEEALKQLQEKSKEIREKKETKRWSKLLQVPKQAAKSEGVRHGLDAKLQETARDIPTQEIPSLETPIQETPTQDKLPVDTPTQDSPTQVILTLDTPSQDTPTQVILPLDTPPQDIPPQDTPQEITRVELTHTPTTASETKEEPVSQGKDLTQTAAAKQTEEAPKQLPEKSKEIREKKETKRWGKLLQVQKQAEKSEGVRHGGDAKLQETARDMPTPSIPTPGSPTQDIPGGELTQKPPTTSETKEESESQDKNLTQTAIIEQAEEAPKQLPEKSKDIREKKETKRWSKVLPSKKAEKSEGVRHGADAKLQETARDIPTPSIPTPDTPTQDISGGELTQKPTATSETKEEPEFQDKDLVQTVIAEEIEEAPKQLPEKSKDIREKKETKRWSKVLPSKKAEKSEGVRHGADAKLQETARDIPTPSIPTPDTPTQDISGGELTQKPTITSETKEEPEFQDKDLVQTVIAEEIEEAPKQLPEKSKDIREKKETKRWSKVLQLPKQAEKSEGVLHGLNIKLQEIAREKDGMIDIETIKHIFEELEPSYKDTAAGPVTGGRHADKLAKIVSVKKSTLSSDTAEQAHTTKEKRRISRVDETALREFQEATLACLDDKLEKLKKGLPGSWKESVQFQPTDPQAQQLFKAIQDKVEECFLIKQKSIIPLEEDKEISQSMEKLEDKSGEEITKIPSSTHVTPTQDIPIQDTSPPDIPTQIPPPPPQDILTQILPPPSKDTPTQMLTPPPQIIPTQIPPPPPQGISTQIPPPPPQIIPTQIPPPPPHEIPTHIPPPPPHEIPTQILPPAPQIIPTQIPPPPPQGIPTQIPPPPPQGIPTQIPPPPPKDMPTQIPPPPPHGIPTQIPPPPPHGIPTQIPPPPPQGIPTQIPPPPPQGIPTQIPPPPPQIIPTQISPPPPHEIPTQIPPPPPHEIPTQILPPPPQIIPTQIPPPPPHEIPTQIPPQNGIPTQIPPPPPHGIPTQISPPAPQGTQIPPPPPQGIPTQISPPAPQGILTQIPPPLPHGIPTPILPPHGIPTPIPPPHGIPTPIPPPPPQGIPTPITPSPPQGIPTLIPPPQAIPTPIPPPQGIPTPIPPPPPPPQGIPTPILSPPPQRIPTPIPPPPPPPQGIPTPILPPPPPPQRIPTPILPPPPQRIPTPIPPPPPQGIPTPILPPPPQRIPTPIPPPPPQGIPTPIPPPQGIPTLIPLSPPQAIPTPIPPPQGIPTPIPPPPPQGIPTPILPPPPQGIPTPIPPPPPQGIPTTILPPPPQDIPTTIPPPPPQGIPTTIPPPPPKGIPTQILPPPPQGIPTPLLPPPPQGIPTPISPPPPKGLPTPILPPPPPGIPTQIPPPPPQSIPTPIPPPPPKGIPTPILPPLQQDIPLLVPLPQEIPILVTPPKDISTMVPGPLPQDMPSLVPPPRDLPSLFPPPQEIVTLFPSPQDIPTFIPPPPPKDIPTLVPPPQDIPPLVPPTTLFPPPQEIPPLFPPPLEILPLVLPPLDIPPLVLPPLEIPPLVLPPLEVPPLILPPLQIPPLVPSPLEIPPLVPPPLEIPIMVPPPGEIPTMVPSPLEISTVVSPPPGIPSLVPPPLEIPSLVPPPLDISPLVLPPQDIPTLVSPPLESPTLLPPPPPQDILTLVPPPQEIPTLVPPPTPKDILPLVSPPQEIPTLVSPPQDISPLVLLPPPKEISPLVQPPQVIPSLVPTPLQRSTLVLPPSPQEIPTLIPSPQVIPTLVLPPPDMPILVPPPEDMPILILPPKKVPILVPPPQDKELFTPQDIPKGQEKEEDLAKALPLTKEEHVPDEGDRWVKELKQEDEEQEKSKIIIPISEEQPKTVDKGKEPSPKVSHSKLKSLQELNMTRELWYQQVQKELLTEKERMQEEQLRIQGECQQIEKAKENLVQWQGLFQKKQEEWKQKEEQHKEQEHLWQRQLEQWRRLQQQNNHYQQYWAEQREKQKEQQCRLQEEVRQLQQQYKQHVILQGEQAKEQWCWNRLKEEHRKQQEIWQEEDKEYESKRRQWQQQQAKHEGQMEALRQAHLQQEEQYKQWQKEQQRKQQELEHAWEKRCQQQLQSWQQKMQKQQEQESRDQEQKSKVPEKQRQKEPKPLSAKLKVVETSVLDIYVKPCKMPPVSKEKIISTTPRTPSPSIALKEDSSELETTWFPKMFTKIEELPSYGIAEKRYWINVDAQRKNLKLLREASQRAGISPDLYNDTKETIKQALHSNVERLAMLVCKYKSLYNLHEVRQSLILQLDTAREANDGARMQNLYKMVDKVDAYQKKLLDNWKVRQNVVEKQRQHCLTQMVDLFAQVHSSAQLHLSNPCLLIVKAEDSTKETFHMPQIGPAFLKSKVYKSPLIRVKKSQDFTVTAMVRRKPSSEQIESLWKTDITELSFPLGPKAPVSVLWPETSGFPDIPRFLELDISSVRGKPLQFMETRIQNIPRWKISGYNFKHL